MQRRIGILLILTAVGCLQPLTARADIPVPGETAAEAQARVQMHNIARMGGMPVRSNQVARLTVEINEDVQGARLLVPSSVLSRLRTLAGGGDDRNVAGVFSEDAPTMAAGTCLSLALVFGGLRLARRRQSSNRLQLGIFLTVVGLAAVSVSAVWAALPPQPPHPDDVPFLPGKTGPMVTVQIVDKGDTIKLLVNRAMLNELTKSKIVNPPQPPGK